MNNFFLNTLANYTSQSKLQCEMNCCYFWYFFFFHLQIHPWNFKISLNPASSGLSRAINGPDMGNHVMTKKVKRMESQNTLLIRESEREEETDDKIFVGCTQETVSWTESELSDSDFSINGIYAFELWCWRRLLRIPWTERRSSQSILKKIGPEYSLEGLMLKLKLQYFGHLMWSTDSLVKTLMLGKIEDRRRRGWQRMRGLGGITDLMMDKEVWSATVHGVTKS